MLTEIESRWLKHLLSTEPSDRPRAEDALRAWYPEILKRPSPEHFFWFDSPERAGWAVKLLESAREKLWQAFVEQKSSHREGRLFLEGLRSELCDKAGLEWDQLTQAAGRHRTQQSAGINQHRIDLHGLGELFRQAARKDHPRHEEFMSRLRPLFGGYNKDDEINRIENRFYEVMLPSCGWGFCLSHSHQAPYTFAKMAEDEEVALLSGREVPPAIAAAWDLARSVSLCWVFEGAVVLLDRPAELRFNSEMFLHCDDGPAGAFRDGTKIWAWNGMVSNEEYILHPENIRPGLWKELAPEFVARIKQRRAAAGLPEPSSSAGKVALKGHVGKAYAAILKSFGKRASVFEKDLPAAIQDRLGVLRAHNRGSLPLLDRYLAGEHEAVWRTLLALGAAVREDPHAADALAVAYETMGRVEANVRTVSDRLVRLGFTGSDGPLHAPPARTVGTQIRELEKITGTLPISLRAFYEIVGSVDWNGQLAGLLPSTRPQVADPFVVLPIEAAIETARDFDDAEEKWVLIAADGLMKANTSGGDPYQIEVPNASADGVLRFECHDLNFVEYLRLVFRWGGFPGYEGMEFPPSQLAELSADLRSF
jgi:uncharacterized protein DUF6745